MASHALTSFVPAQNKPICPTQRRLTNFSEEKMVGKYRVLKQIHFDFSDSNCVITLWRNEKEYWEKIRFKFWHSAECLLHFLLREIVVKFSLFWSKTCCDYVGDLIKISPILRSRKSRRNCEYLRSIKEHVGYIQTYTCFPYVLSGESEKISCKSWKDLHKEHWKKMLSYFCTFPQFSLSENDDEIQRTLKKMNKCFQSIPFNIIKMLSQKYA